MTLPTCSHLEVWETSPSPRPRPLEDLLSPRKAWPGCTLMVRVSSEYSCFCTAPCPLLSFLTISLLDPEHVQALP